MGYKVELIVTLEAGNRTKVIENITFVPETTREKVGSLMIQFPEYSLGKEEKYREFGICFVGSFENESSFNKLENYFLKSLMVTSWKELNTLQDEFCGKCNKLCYNTVYGTSQCRFCPMDRLQHKAALKLGDIKRRKANDR